MDAALYDVVNRADRVLMLVGDQPGAGVTRTSKKFLEQIPHSNFTKRKDRIPILLDLCNGTSCLHACELLALLRNDLVRRVNGARGITALGSHLAAFDAFYVIWAGKTGRMHLAPRLVSTARAKAAKSMAKVTFTFATLGAVHFLGSAHEVAEILELAGWTGESAIDVARENATEGVFERAVTNVGDFVRRFVRPQLDGRLIDAIGKREVRESDAASILHDLLLEAVSRVQNGLGDSAGLMFVLDAIDLTDDDDPDTVEVRFALGGIATNVRRHFVPSVLSGRAPAKLWRRAVPVHQPAPLGCIPEQDIRSRFKSVGLEATDVDEMLIEAGSPKPIIARSLSDAYRRRAIAKAG